MLNHKVHPKCNLYHKIKKLRDPSAIKICWKPTKASFAIIEHEYMFVKSAELWNVSSRWYHLYNKKSNRYFQVPTSWCLMTWVKAKHHLWLVMLSTYKWKYPSTTGGIHNFDYSTDYWVMIWVKFLKFIGQVTALW